MSDRYIDDLKLRLAEERERLAPLEAGEFRIFSHRSGEPQVEITQTMIDMHKRTIGIYEAILAAEAKKAAGNA